MPPRYSAVSCDDSFCFILCVVNSGETQARVRGATCQISQVTQGANWALSAVPPLLPGSYLIGISHFPEVVIQADWDWSAIPLLYVPCPTSHIHDSAR